MMGLVAALLVAITVAAHPGPRPRETEVRRPREGPVVLRPGERRPGDAEVIRHLKMLENMEMLQMLELFGDAPENR